MRQMALRALQWVECVVLFGLTSTAMGCNRLVVSQVETAKTPTSSVSYTGVRASERRFPDYSGIDRKILKDKR